MEGWGRAHPHLASTLVMYAVGVGFVLPEIVVVWRNAGLEGASLAVMFMALPFDHVLYSGLFAALATVFAFPLTYHWIRRGASFLEVARAAVLPAALWGVSAALVPNSGAAARLTMLNSVGGAISSRATEDAIGMFLLALFAMGVVVN